MTSYYKVYFERLILRPDSYLIKIVKDAYFEVTEITRNYLLEFKHIYGFNSICQSYLHELMQDLTINNIAYKIQDYTDDDNLLIFAKETPPMYKSDFRYGEIRTKFLNDERELEAKKKHEAKEAYLKIIDIYHQSSARPDSCSYFDLLSTEIIEKIFRSIPIGAFIECCDSLHLVCQRWHQILKDKHFQVFKLRKNLLVNANCQENTSSWMVRIMRPVYFQDNIIQCFKDYYEPEFDFVVRRNLSNLVIVEKRFKDYDCVINDCYYSITRSIEYLESFNIHEIFNLYRSSLDICKMQIIDLYIFNRDLILSLPKLKAKILYTELFLGYIIINIHLLDENKILISSYKEEFNSTTWIKLSHVIEITQPVRYIIFDHGSRIDLFVKNTSLCITF